MTKVKMKANEAAKELGVELNYLYNLVRTGRLEAEKQDGEWAISAQAVQERINKRGSRSS